jgi:Fe-S-cluster containining protein
VTHGESGFVYLTDEDLTAIAKLLGRTPAAVLRSYCRREGGRVQLKDAPGTQACIFLAPGGCKVYEARPTQCRTWPFWPQNMTSEAWAAVAAFCPGVGRGRLWSAAEIEAELERQRLADE